MRPRERRSSSTVFWYSISKALVPPAVLQAGRALRGRSRRRVEVLLEDAKNLLRRVLSSVKTSSTFREMRRNSIICPMSARCPRRPSEAADVGHLALHGVEPGVVVAAPLQRLAGGGVDALLGGQVLLHDGRHVHLGVGDAQRLHLDVPVLHEGRDDLAAMVGMTLDRAASVFLARRPRPTPLARMLRRSEDRG